MPPLTQEKVTQFSSLFEESGAQNGVLSGKQVVHSGAIRAADEMNQGETAKTIFERAQLPNDVLGRIWNLADTEQRGQLGLTEFVIAMHLLTSFKNGSMRALPQILPAGLYEAAARRGVPRQGTGSRPTSDGSAAGAIPRQFSGQGYGNLQRAPQAGYQSPVQTGEQWAITPQDKVQFDSIYATVDTQNRGFITGDQAVAFFSNARLPEDALAQIWDLADINSEGQLNRDEFAVAMYLIRQQRAKRDGRDVLPQSLPANLIPPSMRRQPIAPPQPTAPTFDNAANITKPKSASEDLFGLDAISTPPPVQPKSQPEPSSITPSSPSRSQTSPPPPSSHQTHFKPFVPSSSFGQTIMTPQGTGTSSSASPVQSRSIQPLQKQNSAMDDLLGDNDPEVSKKLTNDTSELANLSNQVSNLTNQMSEVRTNKESSEQSLGQSQAQKRDFEARLAQLRAAYQQEVKEVQALEERLRASREETNKLQSDMALIQGTHEDLQNQHRQVAEALNADQTENTKLKERISETNAQINDLKPRLEKMRLDARQQKGLVAIYKKQLAGSENERGKIQGDLDGASKEHEDATKELEETKAAAESKTRAPAAVTSPATSSGSMNPFFRRTSSVVNEKGTSSPFASSNVASPNHNAFESFFGPSGPAPTGPPPTSFKSEASSSSRDVTEDSEPSRAKDSPEDLDIPTPLASPPPSNLSDSPQNPGEPPAPPQSRQITSNFLPPRPNLEHSGSESSSIKVVPPASRAEEDSLSGAATPTNIQSENALPQSPKQHFEEVASRDPQVSLSPHETSSAQEGLAPSGELKPQEVTVPTTLAQASGPPSVSREVPGAFPGDDSPDKDSHPEPFQPLTASPYGSSGLDPRVDSAPVGETGSLAPPTQETGRNKTSSSKPDDFESAFTGFDSKGKAPEQPIDKAPDPFNTAGVASNQGEFPPIRELGDEDESDSDEEKGFEDDFTHTSNGARGSGSGEAFQHSAPNGLEPPRPPLSSMDSNHSQLPTPGAQSSPPPYDQSVGSAGGTGDTKESNQFPAEYSGLLPSREVPTSPPTSPPAPIPAVQSNIASSAGIDRGLNFFPESSQPSMTSPMSPGASTNVPYAYTQATSNAPQPPANPPLPPKTAPASDDFDDFGDLSEAKEASDRGEDDIPFSRNRNHDLDDFNPVFDSPAPSHSAAQGSQNSNFPQTDSFANFEASPSASSGPGASRGPGQAPAATSHDWDAIFAGLDTPQNNGVQPSVGQNLAFTPTKSQTTNGTASEGKKGAAAAPAEDESSDDPILKRLTGMGYPRDQSLKALEKYDYNIDKVCC